MFKFQLYTHINGFQAFKNNIILLVRNANFSVIGVAYSDNTIQVEL